MQSEFPEVSDPLYYRDSMLPDTKVVEPRGRSTHSALDLDVGERIKDIKPASLMAVGELQKPLPGIIPKQIIAVPTSEVNLAEVPTQRTFWKWIKDKFSDITAFFISVIFPDVSEPVSPIIKDIRTQLTKLSENEIDNPNDWHKLIELFFLRKIEVSQSILKIPDSINSPVINPELDILYSILPQIRLELLKVIGKNTATRERLDECLGRIGHIQEITVPASLVNNANSCYLDALLQVLFASEQFIKIVKTTDLDVQNLGSAASEEPILVDVSDVDGMLKAKLAAENKAKEAADCISYKPVAIALRNYYLGQEAGVSKTEINKLRDKFRMAVEALPDHLGLNEYGGATGQQDATEMLNIIFGAFKLNVIDGFKLQLNKTYNLASYEIKREEAWGSSLLLDIPSPVRRELSPEESADAAKMQQAYDRLLKLEKAIAIKYETAMPKERNIAEELRVKLSLKAKPLDLQELVDGLFAAENGRSEACAGAIEKYQSTRKAEFTEESFSREAAIEDDTDQLEEKEILEKACEFVEEKLLVGDPPPILTLVIGREIIGRNTINSREIAIPNDEIVYITVSGQPIAYRVVGVAGGNIGTGGGHWVANSKVAGQWYFVNDVVSKAEKLMNNSPNAKLATSSRLYILDRV